jgi:hypothetical protein
VSKAENSEGRAGGRGLLEGVGESLSSRREREREREREKFIDNQIDD